jgi:hypothetical protein
VVVEPDEPGIPALLVLVPPVPLAPPVSGAPPPVDDCVPPPVAVSGAELPPEALSVTPSLELPQAGAPSDATSATARAIPGQDLL